MQTISFLLFRLQESGLGSQDILSEKPWKLEKKYAGIIFTSGEKGKNTFFCVCLSSVSGNLEPKKLFSKICLEVVQNRLKREKI